MLGEIPQSTQRNKNPVTYVGALRMHEEYLTGLPHVIVAMMLGYVKCGQGPKALELFHQMQWEGVHLVPATFIGVSNGSASVSELEEDRHLYEQIIQCGCERAL